MDLLRLAEFDYDPTHWAAAVMRVLGRAWRRTQNRHAALYVGGVCFSAMLAIFPALAILVGVYSLMFTPEQAATQAEAFSRLMPPGPRDIFETELLRLAHAPIRLVSAQSAFAVVIAFYASHRGVKALLAGLSLIHDDERPRGIVGFNLVALYVAVAGFVLISLISSIYLAVRVALSASPAWPFEKSPMTSEWTWAAIGMILGLTLTYRFVMANRQVIWSAAATGAATATVLSMLSSWLGAYYVKQIAHFGATYGSVTAVVVFLIWLSWNVNAVFYGGAVATEMEILAGRRSRDKLKTLVERKARMASQRES
jgi:membrane protein